MAVNPYTRSLDSIVDVVVEISPMAAPRPTFNQMLIVGTTAVIPSMGDLSRIRQYTKTADMLTDGFTNTDPEYVAATLYFDQSPAPDILWVGRQDLTALKTVIPHSGDEGSNYETGDVVTVDKTTGSQLLASWTNSGYDTFTSSSSPDIAAAVDATGGVHADSASISITSGKLYRAVIDLMLTSGEAPTLTATNSGSLSAELVEGENVIYFTATGASTVLTLTNSAACSWSATCTLYRIMDNCGTCTVTASAGVVTGLVPVLGASGTGHAVENSLYTRGGSGTGLKVDVSAVGETPLIALEVCRMVNFQWYVGMVCGATKADHLAIAFWVESASPSSVYAFTTQDADVPTGTAENVFEQLKDLNYSRTIGQYSTDSAYAIAAIMGYAMGQNTGLANSAYTLKFKREVGIDTEDLSSTEINNIEGNNGNVYLSYGNYYSIFEQGKMSNGQFFDEIINLDMLVSDIQLNVMDLLYGTPKIPQTDTGMTQIINSINVACQTAVTRGFLAPGLWTGLPVLELNTNDMLPRGYLVQSPPVSAQSQADREARKSSPMYVAVKEAGAVHSVLIGVYVNR